MDTSAALDQLYTVALRDFDDLPATERIRAETRYSTELEKQLGGPDGVARAYGAWCRVAESDAAEITTEEANTAERWAKTAQIARNTGLRDLGDVDSAYFEIRLG